MTVQDADTLAEQAAQRIEADILCGMLAPDSRLGIAETSARYGVGATPLREALSRLAARGLVNAIGKRGFRVQSISREDLADIVRSAQRGRHAGRHGHPGVLDVRWLGEADNTEDGAPPRRGPRCDLG